ncbi:MAG: hypothetical protein KY464_17890, partial [Gemmatimonadetes bacterium]|nr:hypothetical protein [Gemmatimonadota bacterium]
MIEINLAPGAEARRPSARGGSSLSLPKLPAIGAEPRTVMAGAGALLLVLLIGFGIWRMGQRRAELEGRIAAEVTDSTRFATTIDLVQAPEP